MATTRAVIFDMDGVLIDAKEWHYEALNRALELFGFTVRRREHLDRYDGLPTRTKLAMLSGETDLPAGLHPLINELKQQYTQDLVRERCVPSPRHEHALRNLKAMGYKLAVASNAVRASVELMMCRSGLDRHLDLLLSNEDVRRPKPDPEIYTTAMRRLGVRPDETLVLEDSRVGIEAARSAGACVMAVAGVGDVTLGAILAHTEPGAMAA
jgi:HAD superfamily hydrolase (TIGR01509 family)